MSLFTTRLLAVVSAGALLVLPAAAAVGSEQHPAVVSENPADFTPSLVDTGPTQEHVNAVAQLGNTMYAGGLFDAVTNGGTNIARDNFMMFNRSTGTVVASPAFNDEIWAIESHGDSVYVGGEFSTVGGVQRPRLVKLNADGSVDTSFNANLKGGRVLDLHMYRGPGQPRLFVGGTAGTKLMALNPDTGQRDVGFFDLAITEPIVHQGVTAFGGVGVSNFAISPDGSKLVAVGNFTSVNGQSRRRAFMADLPASGVGSATLSPWYYEPFNDVCASTRARRLAYLSDVDFAPTGNYFVIVATGFNPESDDWGTHVCDAAARFDTPPVGPLNPTEPKWINYTGGDTIWSVAATGAAVYVQGHFQFLDNEFGVGGNPAPTAVTRRGIGALDPDNGEALPWNPGKPAQMGGKQLLATSDGLWVASDSKRFNGEPRHGIAFAPLP